MKYLLMAIFMNAANGDEIERIPLGEPYATYESCQMEAEVQGVVHSDARVAVVYNCERAVP